MSRLFILRLRRAPQCALAVALLAPLLVVSGCESKLRRLAQAAEGFSIAVRAFQQAEIAAHEQGLLDGAEHKAIQGALLDVARAGLELDTAIRVAQSKPAALAALDNALASLDRLLHDAVLHVKNPQARQNLEALLLSARSFLATLIAALA